jgi:hypothetical protein
VKASKAKTASRWLAPVSENLKLWLADYRQVEGSVAPYHNMTKQLLWLAESVDEAWRCRSGWQRGEGR